VANSVPTSCQGDLLVASARHKKSVPARVWARTVVVPAAAALVVVTGIAVITTSVDSSGSPTAASPTSADLSSPDARDSTFGVSRAGARDHVAPKPQTRPTSPSPRKTADVDLSPVWLTEDLNVWSGPGEDFRLLAVIDEGRKIEATGRITDEWAQVRYDGDLAWVNSAYLADEKPVEEEAPEEGTPEVETPEVESVTEEESAPDAEATSGPAGVSGAACPDGSEIEGGLTSNAVVVYRAVCAAFPAVTSWGGLRPGDDGDHGTGQALDIMVYSNSSLGQSIADYVQANASSLHVSEILWAQQIWSVQRASEGWRPLEDRGSPTANHYDHVHVSVY